MFNFQKIRNIIPGVKLSIDELNKDAIGRLLAEHLNASKITGLFTFDYHSVCPYYVEQFYANAQTVKPSEEWVKG